MSGPEDRRHAVEHTLVVDESKGLEIVADPSVELETTGTTEEALIKASEILTEGTAAERLGAARQIELLGFGEGSKGAALAEALLRKVAEEASQKFTTSLTTSTPIRAS